MIERKSKRHLFFKICIYTCLFVYIDIHIRPIIIARLPLLRASSRSAITILVDEFFSFLFFMYYK